LRQIVEKRGLQAGIAGLHLHPLRHTYAHRFLSEGGQESDLMLLAGWPPNGPETRIAGSAWATCCDFTARSASPVGAAPGRNLLPGRCSTPCGLLPPGAATPPQAARHRGPPAPRSRRQKAARAALVSSALS
jgi:hypothetical protein